MRQILERDKVPELYWHDSDWLAIPEHVTQPTYWHLLGLKPGEDDHEVIQAGVHEVRQRLVPHTQSAGSQVERTYANHLIELLATARIVLCDPAKREKVLEVLRDAYRKEAKEFLDDNGVEYRNQVTSSMRQHLLGLAPGHSLPEADARTVLEEVVGGLPEGEARGNRSSEDPAYPTCFDLLEVSPDVTDDEIGLIKERAGEKLEEVKQKARKTTNKKKKDELLRKVENIERALAILLDPAKRRHHKKENLRKREAKFGAQVDRKVQEGVTELKRKLYLSLMEYARKLRLSEEQATTYLREEMGLALPGEEPEKHRGCLGPLPGPVRLPQVRPGQSAEFSFPLTNVGAKKVKARLSADDSHVECPRSVDIEPGNTVEVQCVLRATKLSPGQKAFKIKVSGGGREDTVDVFVTVTAPEPKLRAPLVLEIGRQFIGKASTAELVVANEGDGPLTCDLAAGVGAGEPAWMSLPRGQVVVPPGRETAVPVNLDLRTLEAGPYTGRIRISSNGGSASVSVTMTAARAIPGRLVINGPTEVDLGRVDPSETRAFEVVLANSGDLPVEGGISLERDAWLAAEPTYVKLDGGQKRTVRFTVSPEDGRYMGSRIQETAVFEVSQGTAPGPIKVTLEVCKRPGVLHGWATAAGLVPPMVLAPGLLSLVIQKPGWLSGIFMLLAFAALPVGLAVFHWIWMGRFKTNGEVGLFGSIGMIALGYCVAWLADWILGYMARGILGWFVADGTAEVIVGGILGLLLGGWIAISSVMAVEDKEESYTAGLAMAAAFALACAIGHGYKGMSVLGQGFLFPLVAVAGAVSAGSLYVNERSQLGREWSIGIGAIGGLLTVLLAGAALLTGYGGVAETNEAAIAMARDLPTYWAGPADGSGDGQLRLLLLETNRDGRRIAVEDALFLWETRYGSFAVQRMKGSITVEGEIWLDSQEICESSENWRPDNLRGTLTHSPWRMEGEITGSANYVLEPSLYPSEEPINKEHLLTELAGPEAAPAYHGHTARFDFSGKWRYPKGHLQFQQATDGRVVGTHPFGKFTGRAEGLRAALQFHVGGTGTTGPAEVLLDRRDPSKATYRWRWRNTLADRWDETYACQRVTPSPHTCLLTVETTPPNAEISLAGVACGQAPVSAYMTPGRLTVEGSQPGRPPLRQELVLEPGHRTLHLDLAAGVATTKPAKEKIFTVEDDRCITANGIKRNSVYWVDLNQTKGVVILYFKGVELSGKTKSVILRIHVPNVQNAESPNGFAVFYNNKEVGRQSPAYKGRWHEINLDLKALRNLSRKGVQLSIKALGPDGAAISSKALGNPAQLKITRSARNGPLSKPASSPAEPTQAERPPAAEQTPAKTGETLVINGAPWRVVSGQWTVENGLVYSTDSPADNDLGSVILGGTDATDYVFRARLVPRGRMFHDFGLIFRAADEKNFYYLNLYSKCIGRRINGKWYSRFATWSRDISDSLVEIHLEGPRIRVLADGKQLAEFTDSTFTHGRVGLRSYMPSDGGFRDVEQVVGSAKAARPPEQRKTPTESSKERPKRFTNSLDMKFVRIEPGEFLMGSPADEPGHRDDELLHRVHITDPFYIGVHEVTRGQFAAFAREMAYKTTAERSGFAWAWTTEWQKRDGVTWQDPGFEQGAEHPVVCVSWSDARAFCEWLSTKEGRRYRLPTEAEWEYVHRAGTATAYVWGDSPQGGEGWMNGPDMEFKRAVPEWPYATFALPWSDGFAYTSPVGTFRPNAWGLYDTNGNAWEWCRDWYGPYSEADTKAPTGPTQGRYRVTRGGSWADGHREFVRAARRHRLESWRGSAYQGFRVVAEMASSTEAAEEKVAAQPERPSGWQAKVVMVSGEVVGINKGASDGIRPGMLLVVKPQGTAGSPDKNGAKPVRLRVTKANRDQSFARVIDVTGLPPRVGDRVVEAEPQAAGEPQTANE